MEREAEVDLLNIWVETKGLEETYELFRQVVPNWIESHMLKGTCWKNQRTICWYLMPSARGIRSTKNTKIANQQMICPRKKKKRWKKTRRYQGRRRRRKDDKWGEERSQDDKIKKINFHFSNYFIRINFWKFIFCALKNEKSDFSKLIKNLIYIIH